MKKLLLATLGISTSLLAITPEQQKQVDEIFEKKQKTLNELNISDEIKQKYSQKLAEEKKKVEARTESQIDFFIANQNKKEKEEEEKEFNPDLYKASNELGWIPLVFGASGVRFGTMAGGNLISAKLMYVTIGPKYNFSYGDGLFVGTTKGFSISLPIGIGGTQLTGEKQYQFALPIALEMNYMFSDHLGFGLSAGIRYTYTPRDYGDMHIMDFYAGMDIYYGIYIEAGYVFYSSQDIKVPYGGTQNTDPLSGAVTLNIGWRF